MKPLPFPVRIAAGLVATAVEQARDLPRLVIEFPVTAVSQALQASMRVQQRVTELAIKGDRVLGTLRPVEEKPSWATFDEDEPASHNGTSTVTELRPLGRPTSFVAAEIDDEIAAEIDEEIADEVDAQIADEVDAEVDAEIDEEIARELDAEAAADLAEELADELDDELDKEAEERADEEAAEEFAEEIAAELDEKSTPTIDEDVADLAGPDVDGGLAAAGPDPDSQPSALPSYPLLTIPQLRGRLRFLSVEDLRELLAWEMAHGDRPPYVTMLTNRITTVLEG